MGAREDAAKTAADQAYRARVRDEMKAERQRLHQQALERKRRQALIVEIEKAARTRAQGDEVWSNATMFHEGMLWWSREYALLDVSYPNRAVKLSETRYNRVVVRSDTNEVLIPEDRKTIFHTGMDEYLREGPFTRLVPASQSRLRYWELEDLLRWIT